MNPSSLALLQVILIDVERAISVFALCVVRLMATFVVVPFTGPKVLPTLGRAGLAISLAVIIFPTVYADYPEDGLEYANLSAIVVKEVFIGLAIGYLVSIVFWAAESIGHFIDTHRGATLAGAMFQTLGEQSSPLGGFLLQLTIAMFLIAGGLPIFLKGYYESYLVWPVMSYFPEIRLSAVDFFIDQFALLVFIAVVLAAPIVSAMFLVEFALALMNRFVPQLQVFFLALPVKSAMAIFIMIFYLEFLLTYLGKEMARIGTYYLDLVKLFS